MTTTFIDTNGEMSFVDNERLKFIMHYLKQGADDSLVETKDGRFVREDSELSFTEIWLPAAEHQQRKIDEQQAKVEELQTQLALQRQRVKAFEEELTSSRNYGDELQKRVDSIKQLIQDYLDEEKELELKEWEQSTIYGRIAIELEQALKGEA